MRNTKLRRSKPFVRRTNSEVVMKPKKKYFLVVEGSETEKDYFNGIYNNRRELGIDSFLQKVSKKLRLLYSNVLSFCTTEKRYITKKILMKV